MSARVWYSMIRSCPLLTVATHARIISHIVRIQSIVPSSTLAQSASHTPTSIHLQAVDALSKSFSYTPPHPGASRQCLCVVCPCAVVWCSLVVQVVRACCAVSCAVCPTRAFSFPGLLWMPCVGTYHMPWYMVKLSCKLFAPTTGILRGAYGV